MNVSGMIRMCAVASSASRLLMFCIVISCVGITAAGCGDSNGANAAGGNPILILDNADSAVTLLEATEAGYVTFGADDDDLLLDAVEDDVGTFRSIVSANDGNDLLIGTEAFTVRFRDPDGDGSGQLQILNGSEVQIATQEEFVLNAQELTISNSRDVPTIINALEATQMDLRNGRWRDLADGAQALLSATETAAPNTLAPLDVVLEAAEADVVSLRADLLQADEASRNGASTAVYRVPADNAEFLTGFEFADLLDANTFSNLRPTFAGIADELRLLIAGEEFSPQFLPALLLTLDGNEVIVGVTDGPSSTLKDAQSVVTSRYHTCVIDLDGGVFCWGRGDLNELGFESVEAQLSPMPIDDGRYASLSVSDFHTCGVRDGSGSTGACWGYNAQGQLSVPGTSVPSSADSIDVNQGALDAIAAGHQHTCAVRADGTLWGWGSNDYGQLGFTAPGGVTFQIPPTQVGTDTDWASVSTTIQSSCGLKQNGALFCWGDNLNGQLGLGDKEPTVTPTQVGTALWRSVSTSTEHTCGIQQSGELYCWGSNEKFALGVGDTATESLVPVQVGTESWKLVAVSIDFSCGIRADDTLHCWGQGTLLSSGDPSPLATGSTPTQIGSESWSNIAVGPHHMCGVQTVDSSLWCWGLNDFGQLGTGDLLDRPVPVRISQ